MNRSGNATQCLAEAPVFFRQNGIKIIVLTTIPRAVHSL